MTTERWGKYLVQIPAIAKGSRYVFRGYDTELKREVAIKVYKRIKGGAKRRIYYETFRQPPPSAAFL